MQYQAVIQAKGFVLNRKIITKLKENCLFDTKRTITPDAAAKHWNMELYFCEPSYVHIQIAESDRINISWDIERGRNYVYVVLFLLCPILTDKKKIDFEIIKILMKGTCSVYESLPTPFHEFLIINTDDPVCEPGRPAEKEDRIVAMKRLVQYLKDELGDQWVEEYLKFALNHDSECVNETKVTKPRAKEVLGERYPQCQGTKNKEFLYNHVRFCRVDRFPLIDYVGVYCCPSAQEYTDNHKYPGNIKQYWD